MGLKVITVAVLCMGILLAYNQVDRFDPETVKGKNVIITGASAGIGEQMAYHYARLGANIVITARREQQLQTVIEKCRKLGNKNGKYDYISLDMLDKEAPSKLISYAETALGGIDYIVLNHVYPYYWGEWLGTKENFTRLGGNLEVNFNAYVGIASHAMPYLEFSRGSIIVMSSASGKVVTPFTSHYTASKFALEGFFGSLREEFIMKENGVSVTICTIGLIGTDNALNILERFKQGIISKWTKFGFAPASPYDTALHVVKGGAQRWNTVKYPMSQIYPLLTLHYFVPETMSAFTRFMYT